MAMVNFKLTDAELTEEKLIELEEAEKKKIVFDDDCPEMTPEMRRAFLCAARQRNRYRAIMDSKIKFAVQEERRTMIKNLIILNLSKEIVLKAGYSETEYEEAVKELTMTS